MSLGVVLFHLIFLKIVFEFDNWKIIHLKLIFKIFSVHVKSTYNQSKILLKMASNKVLDPDISLTEILSTSILSVIH